MDSLERFKNIQIADYDYPLPDERIAKFPLTKRDESKLLVAGNSLNISQFKHIADYLPSGALMVMNNTKVIQARIEFRKATGARIEIFLLEPIVPRDYEQMFQARGKCQWLCLVGNLKKWKGESIEAENLSAKLVSRDPLIVEFNWEGSESFAEVIDRVGELPIPPYLNRKAEESDKTTYQTIYSKIKGSVAAPTAGLHFTPEVLETLNAKGIERQEVTLHVGAGTFKPVKSENIGGHEMHTEFIEVTRDSLIALLKHNCQAIAVGTTSVRTLESLYYIGRNILEGRELAVNQWDAYENAGPQPSVKEAIEAIISHLEEHKLSKLQTNTQIIIVPGYEFKVVKTLITNLHQPKSTLLLLVDAFLKGRWRAVYDYALNNDFRFLSYGDSCLLTNENQEVRI